MPLHKYPQDRGEVKLSLQHYTLVFIMRGLSLFLIATTSLLLLSRPTQGQVSAAAMEAMTDSIGALLNSLINDALFADEIQRVCQTPSSALLSPLHLLRICL